MSTTPIQQPWMPWIEAADRVIKAVNAASLEELRSPIEKELGLSKEVILPVLLDHVDDLKQLAMLGYPGAIQSLVSIARNISTFLATLSPPAEAPAGDGSTSATARNNSSKTHDDQPKKDRWPEINQAAAHLYDVVIKHYESCKDEFDNCQSDLPGTAFSFPLEILLGRSGPPDPPLKLVADFCDGLIQQRFNSEIREFMLPQTTNAWSWPIVVTAEQYKANRTLKDCAPDLRLGESIQINIFSGVKRGPKELATQLFKVLEKERLAPRSKSHLEELRHDEEKNIPEPLEDLISKADSGEAAPIFYVGAMPPRWDIHNIWLRKAALLPELSRDSHIIEKWTEAAYAYAASVCGGGFENYQWSESTAAGTRRAGSIKAGLKLTFRDGFKSIAKGDAES